MRVGTKSVLFGAHCFFLHPWFVALAWWKLYGFPLDPRLWVAFFVHDLGYLGKPNMDGPEGESHPKLGAQIMTLWFDDEPTIDWDFTPIRHNEKDYLWVDNEPYGKWGQFSLLHSRFLSKQNGVNPSLLCVADKFALCLTPAWLYLPMVRATGEIREYMKLAEAMNDGAGGGKYSAMNISTKDQKAWYADVQDYLRRWVAEHKDGREDTWTPAQKQATTETGVWK
jgi:hypothetical protein